MTKLYAIQKIPEHLSISAAKWEDIPQLAIEHFLWKNNGYRPEVYVQLCYDEKKLYLRFHTYEQDPLIRYYQMNEPVYTDSCVEFFVQPSPEQDLRYLNFEINAAGTLLLGLGKNRDRTRLRDVDPALFQIKASVHEQDPIKQRKYWEIEYSIPFTFIQNYFPEFTPQEGTRLKANFYKCGDETAQPHYGCWNLIDSNTPNFHVSQYFGELVLQ